jgi:hypothetical protein
MSSAAWRTNRYRNQQKAYSGGGSKRRWSMKWTFDATPTRVHFGTPEVLYSGLDGEGGFPFRVGERYYVSNGGPKRSGTYVEVHPEQDVIAAYTNPQAFGLEVDPIASLAKIRPQIYYGVSGWIEEWFHLVEKKSKSDSSKTYFDRERCTGRGCEHCKAKVPKVFGKKFYATVARSHWDNSIFLANQDVGTNCKCGGFVYFEDYHCENCNHILVDVCHRCESCDGENIGIDPENAAAVCQGCETSWSVLEQENSDIAKLVASEMKCQNCNHSGIPIPTETCTNCDSPNPYGIFDCQLILRKTGSGKQSELIVDDWEIQDPDPKLFDTQYQGPDAEKASGIAEGMKKVLNLNEIFEPESPENQAQLCHVPNPFSSKNPTKQGFAKFSRHQQEEAAGEEKGDDSAPQQEEEAETEDRTPSKIQGRRRFGRRNR